MCAQSGSGRQPQERLLGWVWQDLRYAVRSLIKDGRFRVLAVLALALGIGSATIIFSAVYGVILNTFGYDNPDKIVSFAIHDASQSGEEGREAMSMPEFLDFRRRNNVLTDMTGGFGGFGGGTVLFNTGESTEQFSAWYTTANLFTFMGTNPFLGRLATTEDTKPGATPVFMMTYKTWRERFNADPSIVGKSFTLNGTPRTLVGVMPPRFRWGWTDIWIPLAMDLTQIASDPNLKNVYVWPVGRLKPGVSVTAASADLDVVAHQLAKIYPHDYPQQFKVAARTLADRVLSPFKSLIYPLVGAVALLLLIACSNVANLLLARATARDREIAIRASIGASRGRLIRQLLVESFVLAAAGCLAGCIFASVGIQKLVPLVPYGALPQEAVIELNIKVLLFSLAVTALTTMLCGLAPALHVMRGELQNRLTGSGKGSGGGFRHGKLRAALVIAEVAFSIVLLVGAGLMMRTFLALDHVDLGFNPRNILVAELNLSKGIYDTAQQKNILFQQIFARLQTLPGVVASTVTVAPPPGGGIDSELTVPGKTHSERWTTAVDAHSAGYFQTLGLPLLRGKLFDESDVASGRHVTVVSASFSRRFFPNDDPLGQKIKFNALDELPELKDAYFDIIGVVPDVRNRGLQDPPMSEAYVPHTITGIGDRAILVRTAMNPDSLLPIIRQQIWAVDRNISVSHAESIQARLQRDQYAGPEFDLVTFGAFAAIGLLLAVIGIFSVMAYTVSLQTHEIGIRMALGAQKGNILTMVLRNGLTLIVTGIILGVVASPALTRFIASQLSGVKVTDPWTFVTVAVIILAVGLAACFFPARRATQVDPLIALRYE
jgi:putative ABC transport system permease protein